MQNILEILKANGIEVTEEQIGAINKAVADNYKTVAEFDKKVIKLEAERDGYKTQFETASDTLKNFEGIDPKKISDELTTWKTKAENAEKDAAKKLAERDYEDALKTEVQNMKFTSNAAKKAFIDDLKAAGLPLKDGKIFGLNDFTESYKKSDATAFVNEEQEQAKDQVAQFTTQMGAGAQQTVVGDPNKMDYDTYKKWRAQNQ